MFATGFGRERRNLLITSFILFFYHASGIRIDKINALGNEVTITDAYWVPVALWVLWFYFGLRYYQYFREIPDKGFATAYRQRFDQLTKTHAEKKFRRDFNRETEFPEEELKALDCRLSFDHRRIGVSFDSGDSMRLAVVAAVCLQGPMHLESRNLTKLVELCRRDLLIARFRSWIPVAVSTRLLTEYVLPFMIALLPLVSPLIRS
jgi:hypothetical protein